MQLSNPVELIKKSLQIFFKKENLIYFLKIYAILIPFIIITYLFDLYTHNFNFGFNLASISQTFGALPLIFLIFVSIVGLGYLIVSFWVGAAGILAVANVINGTVLPFKEVLRAAWKKLWIFSILNIVVGFVITLGSLLLIIPGIIFLVWYQFSKFEILTKDVGIGAAMGGSKRLVAGRFFPVFGRILVFGLFGIIIEIAAGAIPFGIGSLIQPFLGPLFILPTFLLYKELNG